jgi:hypothetical protein
LYVVLPAQVQLQRTICQEFIMKLFGGDVPGLILGKSAKDAAEEVGHGRLNVQHHA